MTRLADKLFETLHAVAGSAGDPLFCIHSFSSLQFFLCSLTTHYGNIPETMNCLFIMLWLKYISHYVGKNETDEEKRTCADLFLAGGLNNINFRVFHLPPPPQLCAPSILSAVKWVSF